MDGSGLVPLEGWNQLMKLAGAETHGIRLEPSLTTVLGWMEELRRDVWPYKETTGMTSTVDSAGSGCVRIVQTYSHKQDSTNLLYSDKQKEQEEEEEEEKEEEC